jgi:hypothetical protein
LLDDMSKLKQFFRGSRKGSQASTDSADGSSINPTDAGRASIGAERRLSAAETSRRRSSAGNVPHGIEEWVSGVDPTVE